MVTKHRMKDYEIPTEHLQKLNMLCGLDEFSPQESLPDPVRITYIKDRVRADRVGKRFNDSDLWNIVCRSAAHADVPSPKPKDPTIVDLWNDGKVKRGDPVLCRWRRDNGFKTKGTILGITRDGRPVVQFDDDSEERQLNPIHVKPATKTRAVSQAK